MHAVAADDTAHDLRLDSGERQVAGRYEDIRADHRYRYEWVASRLPPATFGLDAFCGNGYGSHLLSRGRQVIGIDGSPAAIECARANYDTVSNMFACKYWPFELPAETFDFVVSLESIEHVPDGEDLFRRLAASLRAGGDLFFSVPCEDFLPFRPAIHPFHARHFHQAELPQLIRDNGLEFVASAGQNTYRLAPDGTQHLLPELEQVLRDGEPGQFIIVHCRKPAANQRPSTTAGRQ